MKFAWFSYLQRGSESGHLFVDTKTTLVNWLIWNLIYVFPKGQ